MYVLCLDQGTTGTTVAFLNQRGEFSVPTNQEYRQIYPKPGWVESDPEEIWKSVTSTITEAKRKTGVTDAEIQAIGITNQRETVIVWDRKTGRPIYNAISWQCRRTGPFCDRLKKSKNTQRLIQKKTGLVIDPYFSASKIRWILDRVSGAREKAKRGELAAGTIDTFLMWRLSGGQIHATDVSNASRTQLMNIKTGQWDEKLLNIFGLPKSILPTIYPSSGVFGMTAKHSFLHSGVPISGVAGDQQAALFGGACYREGEAKCTYGTGSFILMNTGHNMTPSKAGLLTTVAWQLTGEKKLTYALEGSVFISGAAVQWLRDGLGILKSSSEVESLAKTVSSTEGVEFIPALSGLGAPYWNPQARGVISGITRGTTKAHIARATLEAMALQNAEILKCMEKDLKKDLKVLKVDGGACANNLLMQLQSDYLGIKLIRPKCIETTALGAGLLAGLGIGLWKNKKEIKTLWKSEREFKPCMTSKARHLRFKTWRAALKKL